MKRHLLRTAAAVAATLASTSAFAQDRSTHFDGLYISGFVGMGLQNNDNGDSIVFDTDRDGTYGEQVNLASPPAAPGTSAFSPGFCNGVALTNTPAGGCRSDRDRVEFGGRVGFDKRVSNNFVLGGLFEVSTNRSQDGVTGYSTTPASYSFQREIDHAFSLRARAGYTPGGGALFYVTGGGSYAKIDHDFAVINNSANTFTPVNDGKRVWGWQAGGGAEIMLTNNISLGLEYLYNRYDDDKYYIAVTQGTAGSGNPFIQASAGGTNMRPSDTRFDYHSVRASLSFQF